MYRAVRVVGGTLWACARRQRRSVSDCDGTPARDAVGRVGENRPVSECRSALDRAHVRSTVELVQVDDHVAEVVVEVVVTAAILVDVNRFELPE